MVAQSLVPKLSFRSSQGTHWIGLRVGESVGREVVGLWVGTLVAGLRVG